MEAITGIVGGFLLWIFDWHVAVGIFFVVWSANIRMRRLQLEVPEPNTSET